MAECKRCGRCCQDVRLAESPDMLERAYKYWKKTPSIDPGFSEIYLSSRCCDSSTRTSAKTFRINYRCVTMLSMKTGCLHARSIRYGRECAGTFPTTTTPNTWTGAGR